MTSFRVHKYSGIDLLFMAFKSETEPAMSIAGFCVLGMYISYRV